MIAWFKRKRPQPVAAPIYISPEDRLIAAYWGYTDAQRAALDNHVRTVKRSGFYSLAGL